MTDTAIRPAYEVMQRLENKFLDDEKYPHSISYPVIHQEKGRYYLAVFMIFFTADEIREQRISRPAMWVLMDIKTGVVVKIYDCIMYDFAKGISFSKKYFIGGNIRQLTKDDRTVLENLLDHTRDAIATCGIVDMAIYRAYMTGILQTVPDEYKVFYEKLSIPKM